MLLGHVDRVKTVRAVNHTVILGKLAEMSNKMYALIYEALEKPIQYRMTSKYSQA